MASPAAGSTSYGASDLELGSANTTPQNSRPTSPSPEEGCCTVDKCCTCFHAFQCISGTNTVLGTALALGEYFLVPVWTTTDLALFGGGIWTAATGLAILIRFKEENTNRNLQTAVTDVRNVVAAIDTDANKVAGSAGEVNNAAGLLADQVRANSEAQASYETERAKQIKQIAELGAQLDTITKQRDAASAQNEASVKARDAAIQELVQLKGVFEQLATAAQQTGQKSEVIITTMTEIESNLKKDLGSVQAMNKDLAAKDEGAKAHKAGLIAMISNIKNAIAEKNKQLDAQQSQINTLTSQISTFDEARKQADAETTRLQKEMETLQARLNDLEALKKQQAAANTESDKAQENLAARIKEVDGKLKKYAALKEEVKQAQATLKKEREEFDKAKAQEAASKPSAAGAERT